MTNDLINLSKNLIAHIANIDDLIDSYFDPINDYTDTVKDIFTPIKAIHSLYTLNKKRKFKNFLKAYAESLNDYNLNILENTERLKDYLKVERNFNFLNDLIENAINAKSVYGSMILGYYAGQILAENEQIGFKELIIIEGLKELNDFELSSLFTIYSRADLSTKVNYSELNLSNNLFHELTIEKLFQLRWLERDYTNFIDSTKNFNFHSTEIAENVFFLIKDTPLYKELLDYEF